MEQGYKHFKSKECTLSEVQATGGRGTETNEQLVMYPFSCIYSLNVKKNKRKQAFFF